MKNKFGLISLFLSLMVVILTIQTNLLIAETYISSNGKNKALFGIIELTNFSYKYFYILICIMSFYFAWLYSKKSKNFFMITICFLFSLLSGILVFLRLWIYFV